MNNSQEPTVSSGWCNIKAAAAHIGMSVGFVRKAVRQGEIPFARAGSKALRFRKADLDRWLEANGCGGEVGYADKAR